MQINLACQTTHAQLCSVGPFCSVLSHKLLSNVFPIVVAKKEDGSRVQNGDHLPTLKKPIIFSVGFLPFSNFLFSVRTRKKWSLLIFKDDTFTLTKNIRARHVFGWKTCYLLEVIQNYLWIREI